MIGVTVWRCGGDRCSVDEEATAFSLLHTHGGRPRVVN